MNGAPVLFLGEGALLTVGPPGTGKSRGVAVWKGREGGLISPLPVLCRLGVKGGDHGGHFMELV
jgi:hypothetical protein